mmetsp:Transcript_34627/g.83604  ORF Transcript_34627/g.83604 Transcript_34627/m.83604 type:complete len:256 (+) Transcript_34627:23-790(+)
MAQSSRVVVVTGAGGDIGSAIARRFHKRGDRVVLFDLPSSAVGDLHTSLGDRSLLVHGDVVAAQDVQRCVAEAEKAFGYVDVMINNAGIQGPLGPAISYSEKAFLEVIDVNVRGVFLGLQAAAQSMLRSGRGGVILNLSSLAAARKPENMIAYNASKAAVESITATAAKELGPSAIRVVAVAPGLLTGRLWTTQVQGQASARRRRFQDQEAEMLEGVPLRRLGTPQEVAGVLVWLASDEAAYVSGAVVPITGARM